MNCYGTNPNHTQQFQPVNAMNTMNPSPVIPAAPQQSAVSYTNPYSTTTSGEWSQPIPTNPNMPTSPVSIASAPSVPAPILPPTLTEPIYTPGYLAQRIGSLIRVEFLIGNSTTDRVGRLKTVGASFIVLQSLEGNSEIVCDIYSIRFVTIINSVQEAQTLAAFPNN